MPYDKSRRRGMRAATPVAVHQNPRVRSALKDVAESYPRKSSARTLLKHATGWAGQDLDQRIAEVYAVRAKAKF